MFSEYDGNQIQRTLEEKQRAKDRRESPEKSSGDQVEKGPATKAAESTVASSSKTLDDNFWKQLKTSKVRWNWQLHANFEKVVAQTDYSVDWASQNLNEVFSCFSSHLSYQFRPFLCFSNTKHYPISWLPMFLTKYSWLIDRILDIFGEKSRTHEFRQWLAI